MFFAKESLVVGSGGCGSDGSGSGSCSSSSSSSSSSTARSWRLPAAATPLVSECGKCSVNIGISVSLLVQVPQ